MRALWALPLLVFLSPSFLPASLRQQPQPSVPATADSLLFEKKKALMAAQPDTSHAALVLVMGRSFLGQPYVSGVLDRTQQEQLVVNFREMDCWTHVECSVALTLGGSQSSFEEYRQQLQKLRYWGGNIEGYGSRIHYFTGWLLQAEKLGILQDLTRDMGGIPYVKQVGYISARPHKYPKIKDEKTLAQLRSAEARINKHRWYYIPKSRVAAMEHLLHEGDLIILTSAKADLDISHQGFAVRQNGRIHLLHASSLNRKVIISALPLPQYLAKQRGQSGIIVARLL